MQEVVKCESLHCKSVDRSNAIIIRSVAKVLVTFKESESKQETRLLTFCVVDGSTEDMILGKPTLDALGYVSNKTHIELQELDLRFSTILPAYLNRASAPQGTFLHLSEHYVFDGRPDAASVSKVQVRLDPAHASGHWWMEQGPDCPFEVQVVEGPIVPATANKCEVEVIADGRCRVGTGEAFLSVRPVTKQDFALLDEVRQLDQRAAASHEAVAECKAEAALLVANYAKKDRAAKQEALFPVLEEEIKKGREALKSGIVCPDQTNKAFKDEVVRATEPLIDKRLNATQRRTLVDRILRPFSMVFWMAGCHAPRVEGYEASLTLKTDPQPRIQQPYKLSAFDQKRLEFHEDMEVAEGKAVWGPPGASFSWGSPSFVVDQPGKGTLGRPVRDYRWPNS